MEHSPYDAMHMLVPVSWPKLLRPLGWDFTASCNQNPVYEIQILGEVCHFRMSCWSILKRLMH
jgi:hypothetical protein